MKHYILFNQCFLPDKLGNKLFLLLLVILLMSGVPMVAQIQVNGVVSTEDQSTLPGVNIVESGTANGTVTNINGQYSIIVQSDSAVLIFSSIGFISQEIRVGLQRNISIVLLEDVETLDEVVVIGYGTVRKSDLTGAVSSVRGEDLVKIPAASPQFALQGKVPGVQVTSSSGAPGAAPTVRIRGVGTFGNPDPIYVVDGMILDDINFLSSNDIESIEVLKDASATAIYGSRGANGVILVTTKAGKLRAKPTVTLSAQYSFQLIEKYIDMLNGKEFAVTLNKINPGSFNNVNKVNNVDYQQEVYRPYAPMQDYQLSVGGGSEEITYYIAAGYFKQEGIIPGSEFERLSIKINNQYNISKHVRLGHNVAFSPFEQQNAANVVASTLRAWPTDLPKDEEGNFLEVRGNGNPLASIHYNNSENSGFWGVGTFFGEVMFAKDFTFKSSFGIDYRLTESQSFTPEFYVSPTQQNPESNLYKGRATDYTWLWENTLNYNKQFKNQRIDAVIGYTAQRTSYELLGGRGTNLIRDDILYLTNDLDRLTIENPAFQQSILSYLVRANYSLLDRYLLTASFRADGSSKFSEENRWGYFPSFAVGWLMSNEAFLMDSKILTNLKLRGSWGVIGNEKVNYTNRFTLIELERGAVFGPDEVLYPGATYGQTGNPEIRWEEAEQLNLGIDLGFFEDKLMFEFDYYRKVTNDILINLLLPGHFGNGSFTYTTFNAADVLNRGFEFLVGWKHNIGKFSYAVGANGTTVYNEVLSLGPDTGTENFIPMGSLGNGQNVKRVEVGAPIGYFFGYVVDGIFQTEEELDQYPRLSTQGVGDFRYKDVDGDGEITPGDRTNIGSPIPDFIYGFNIDLYYWNFALTLDFYGEYGKEIYNGKNAVRAGQYNYETSILDAWDGPGTSNTEPRPTAGGVNYSESDWFVQDGSFFRLRSIRLAYSLPEKAIKAMRMKNFTVFLSGTNVFTISDYTGYTPEIGGDIRMNGIDTGIYPVTSIYTIGLNVNF
jgi:TonB-linked SusC/RagA family outer membrane protein